MITIAVCDDESAETSYISGLTRKWAANRSISARFLEYSSAESFLFAYEDDKSANILLLDIQMGGMDGVSLARTIRKSNKTIQIIFVTGYMDYIADGYDVDALHYLLKPVTEEKLASVLDRAMDKLAYNERALYISRAGETELIPMHEIQCVEVRRNYVTVYAKGEGEGDGEYVLKKTLGEIEKELGGGFFRLGRSYIVNLRHIRKITKTDVHLMGGMVVPLPRRLYGEINKALIEQL